jgi:hypothetical protein
MVKLDEAIHKVLNPLTQERVMNPSIEELYMECHKRTLLAGLVKLGKTFKCINEYAIEAHKKGLKIIYITLDSKRVRAQETTEFKKAGFKKIHTFTANNRLTHKNSKNIDVGIFTTNSAYDKDLQSLINWWHGAGYSILFILDEYDFSATGVQGYKASKADELQAALKSLKWADEFLAVSATHTQLLNMPMTFTHVDPMIPYKEGYCSLLGLVGAKHTRTQIADLDLEQFIHEELIPNSILNILNKATIKEKVNIKLTRWVSERDSNNYIPYIAEKITKQTGKKVYQAIGGKEGAFREDPDYIKAEVIISGQPTERAVELPDIRYTIGLIPKHLDKGLQESRMDGYSPYEKILFTNSEGIKILEEYDIFGRLILENIVEIAKMIPKEREDWTLQNLRGFQYIKFFGKKKEGQFKTKPTGFLPEGMIEYTPEKLEQMEEMGFPCIDDISETIGKEGTYLQRDLTLMRWINMCAILPARSDKHTGKRWVVPFGNYNNKKAGYLKIRISARTRGTKWSQFHVENGKLYIKWYDERLINGSAKHLQLKVT